MYMVETLFFFLLSSTLCLINPADEEPQRKRRRKDKPLKCLALLQPDPHSKEVRK